VTAKARLEFRVRPERRARIEAAARLAEEPVSEFVRSAAEERADRMLREHDQQTRVPSAYFDELLAALDAPAVPDEALARGAERARHVVTRT